MFYFILAAVLCGADLIIKKYIKQKNATARYERRLGCMTITYLKNKGAMLGFLKQSAKLLLCITLTAIGFIAGVLAMHPEVLILDEPTAGLDPKGRNDILDQVAELHAQGGLTVILVSHSMEDVAKYVERLIVMNGGSVMFDDTPKAVFKNYKALESIGLAAPQVTYLMDKLREKGMKVPENVTTVEEAKAAILAALDQRGGVLR